MNIRGSVKQLVLQKYKERFKELTDLFKQQGNSILARVVGVNGSEVGCDNAYHIGIAQKVAITSQDVNVLRGHFFVLGKRNNSFIKLDSTSDIQKGDLIFLECDPDAFSPAILNWMPIYEEPKFI